MARTTINNSTDSRDKRRIKTFLLHLPAFNSSLILYDTHNKKTVLAVKRADSSKMKNRFCSAIVTHTKALQPNEAKHQLHPLYRWRKREAHAGPSTSPEPAYSEEAIAAPRRVSACPGCAASPHAEKKFAAGRAGAPNHARRAPHPMAPSARLPLGAFPPRPRLHQHPHLTPPAAASGAGEDPQGRHGAAPASLPTYTSPLLLPWHPRRARERSKGPSPPPELAPGPPPRSPKRPRRRLPPGPSRAVSALTRRTEPRTTSETLCRSSAAVPGLLSARVNFRVSGAPSAMAASALLRPGPPAALTARPPGGPSRGGSWGRGGGRREAAGREPRQRVRQPVPPLAGSPSSAEPARPAPPPPNTPARRPEGGAGRGRRGRLARRRAAQRGGASACSARGPAPTCTRGVFLIGRLVTCPAATPHPHWLSADPRPRWGVGSARAGSSCPCRAGPALGGAGCSERRWPRPRCRPGRRAAGLRCARPAYPGLWCRARLRPTPSDGVGGKVRPGWL